jgi:hypothetical protein
MASITSAQDERQPCLLRIACACAGVLQRPLHADLLLAHRLLPTFAAPDTRRRCSGAVIQQEFHMAVYPASYESAAPAVAPVSVAAPAVPASSAVSWAAIFVGACAAAALSLILVILGFGLGLSAVSPWTNTGASGTALGISTILWIAFTQLAASALGGYLAGRLRVKWTGLHTDEVYFRDTAHGFMAWAVATLFTAAMLGSALSSVVGAGVRAGASLAGGAAGAATSAALGAAGVAAAQQGSTPGAGNAPAAGMVSEGLDYFVDALFRKDASHQGTPTNPATRAEAAKIFAADLRSGSMPDEDRQYLGAVVAQETGLSPPDAERRVADKFNQTRTAIDTAQTRARQAADEARKVAAHSALWTFVGLLLGAFCASLAATWGGRRRDEMV